MVDFDSRGRVRGLNSVGRPAKFKTVEELTEKVEEYFAERNKQKKRPTLTSMYVYIGAWHGYFNELVVSKPEFSGIVKLIISKISENYEDGTNDGSVKPALGIFMLKNCGYADKMDINANVSTETSLAELAKQAQNKRKNKNRRA